MPSSLPPADKPSPGSPCPACPANAGRPGVGSIKPNPPREVIGSTPTRSPDFQCPHCTKDIAEGLEPDADKGACPHCSEEVFLTDMPGFHQGMGEDAAPLTVASDYMLVMEHLMLFTPIRLAWESPDPRLVGDTLFLKDGPLTRRRPIFEVDRANPRVSPTCKNGRETGPRRWPGKDRRIRRSSDRDRAICSAPGSGPAARPCCVDT